MGQRPNNLSPADKQTFQAQPILDNHIRSYVLRQGRISEAQRRNYDTLMPVYGIAYAKQCLALEKIFNRTAPKILEIGFGMGETTTTIAENYLQNDYLALEVHTPGVGSLLKQIQEKKLSNICIIQHDAVEVLRDMLAEASLDGAHIYFPDPWHKARHNKRRLVQAPFIALLASKLKTGAYLHLATDWENYAQQMLAVLSAEPSLYNTAADYAPRPAHRPLTKFENRGLKLGHGVWDLIFEKC